MESFGLRSCTKDCDEIGLSYRLLPNRYPYPFVLHLIYFKLSTIDLGILLA